MGEVYEGLDSVLDRKVAIKVLLKKFADDELFHRRFLREAKAASKIQHPNIVHVIDFGITPSQCSFYVMEFLVGHDLQALLRDVGPLPWSRVRNILLQITRALGAVHEQGIVHRDVKPSNFFVHRATGLTDFMKLLDFGIAKLLTDSSTDDGSKIGALTETGVVLGTAKYMAPEQARAIEIDQRADVYSVGIVAYEMLTGMVPFVGTSAFDILRQHVQRAPRPPRELDSGISVDIQNIVLRALAKRPEDRFSSMDEMERALLAVPSDGRNLGWTPVVEASTVRRAEESRQITATSVLNRATKADLWEDCERYDDALGGGVTSEDDAKSDLGDRRATATQRQKLMPQTRESEGSDRGSSDELQREQLTDIPATSPDIEPGPSGAGRRWRRLFAGWGVALVVVVLLFVWTTAVLSHRGGVTQQREPGTRGEVPVTPLLAEESIVESESESDPLSLSIAEGRLSKNDSESEDIPLKENPSNGNVGEDNSVSDAQPKDSTLPRAKRRASGPSKKARGVRGSSAATRPASDRKMRQSLAKKLRARCQQDSEGQTVHIDLVVSSTGRVLNRTVRGAGGQLKQCLLTEAGTMLFREGETRPISVTVELNRGNR